MTAATAPARRRARHDDGPTVTTGARPALVLIATPIGNLGDLSARAVAELTAADAIACEDTRRTGRLLEHAGVPRRPLIVVNDHTEAAAVPDVMDRLARDERVAVVTDAGTPGISDPGERLVRAAVAAGFDVEVVPGPSAAITALVSSGLPTGRFVFEGFLPRKGSGRSERLAQLAGERRTIVLYEAPHRLVRTLHDLSTVIEGARRVALARELTKLHEEIWRGDLDGAIARCVAIEPRGEYVIVVDGAPPVADATDDDVLHALADARARGASTKDAVNEVSDHLDVPKKRVYALATTPPRDPTARP
jgi:16S rRNA (cytidine1402-2'-O)-methyltransferase